MCTHARWRERPKAAFVGIPCSGRKWETIVVTDRGVPKVVISAAPGVDQLDLGVSEGWITPPKNINGLGPHVIQKSKRRSSDVLNEDRGE